MRLSLPHSLLPFIFIVSAGLGSAQIQPYEMPSRAVNRILEQATWGPTPAGSLLLEKKGFDSWYISQLTAPVSTYADQPLLNAVSGFANTNITPVQTQFFQNAVSGPDQLRQRVAFALSEIWVVSEVEINNASAFPPLLRIFQSDAFSNYEQIMTDVTLNPAMGRYLNMVNNDKGNPARNTTPNENYGREILQLFTLGLNQLHNDGSPMMGGNGAPLPSYTQSTVTAVAKALTGWTYPPMPGATTRGHNTTYYIGQMVPVQSNHDATEKAIFPGYTLPAGETAEQDLTAALHAIFMQPSLPPFISHQLIQHLTTSNPSPAYIERVTNVFLDNGSGIRGDMQAVIKAILTDPEARAGDDPNNSASPNYGHMRQPVLFAANLLRAMNGTVPDNSGIAGSISSLGQNLFSAPSVFSYFSPFSRTPDGLPAPEFQIFSTQAATNRINLVNAAIYGATLGGGTKIDLTAFANAASAKPSTLLGSINALFFHSNMSDSLKTAVTAATNAVTLPSDKAKAALYVALSSGEYQIIN